MKDATVEKARAFIDGVRKKKGGLKKEQRENLKRNEPEALEMIDNLRHELGAATKTLATNLYSKDCRFVYELIQNAEDNIYNTAHAASEPCWLMFNLCQDRIVIDSNEDGFTQENIRAICSIGKSTKACIQGYIGEKGIGFKSVFKVARKVHVQSGSYSFSFEYERGGIDNGLGMVTPMNENLLEIPVGVRTRMILHLFNDCDRDDLYKEFSRLPETLLLFLKKLRQLSLRINLPGHPKVDQTYCLTSSGNRVSIEKKVGLVKYTQKYWITKRQVTDMPNDLARKDIHEAEVILAFPLDANEIPVIEEQHVCAFLPLRKVGYKFLIQSDFITQASREDVFDTAWNKRLLVEVNAAFLSSVENFLRHPILKYHWVRYVPTSRIADDFWGRLQPQITKTLLSRKVFFSRDGSKFAPGNLRIITERFSNDDGQPLLRDLSTEITAYISESYNSNLDVPVLKHLGISDMNLTDFLTRLEDDLTKFADPLMFGSPTDEWHNKVATILIEATKHVNASATVRRLPIVPLANGKWVRPLNATIFFPTSGGIAVPTDLSLSLIEASALRIESRKTLFSRLGVTECEPLRVFPLIEQRYRSVGIKAFESRSHIKFMFWHHTKLPPEKLSIRLAPTYGDGGDGWFSPLNKSQGWTYCLQYKGRYSAAKIFGSAIPTELEGEIQIPRFYYYESLEKCEHRNDRTALDWFREYFEMKDTLQLCNRDSKFFKNSPEFDYVAKNEPQYLLGMLEVNQSHFPLSDTWDLGICHTVVPILHSKHLKQLDTTYLPLPKLTAIVDRLGLSEDFGFLEELEDITEATAGKWRFLERFHVGVEEDVSFWLALLRKAWKKEGVQSNVVFEIYQNLQKYSTTEEVEILQEAFESEELVYVPSSHYNSGSAAWKNFRDCLWSGPDWFAFKLRLASIDGYQRFSSLFVTTLGTADATCDDYLAYLRYLKDFKRYNTVKHEEPKISKIYEQLDKETDPITIDVIRDIFEKEDLIYFPTTQTWHCQSSCIWAEDRVQLPEKVSLATAYKSMSSFFVKMLKITKPSLHMHILALKQKVYQNPDRAQIMQEIMNICALNPTAEALKELSDCKCLPVKMSSGAVQWMDPSEPFAIVDRHEYGALFAGKVNVLDCSLEEVHPLQLFLIKLGLEERYMSKAVREETAVQGGLLSRSLTDDLRKKAYAICRYAAHYGSAKVRDDLLVTFQLLQNLEAYLSDNISKCVSLDQNGESVVVQQESAYFHLAQHDHKLSLYVPKSKKRRLVCLSRQLPISLLNHLGARSTNSGAELGTIITATQLFVVDELLQQAGIIQIPGIEPHEDDSGYESSSSESEQIVVSRPRTPVFTPYAGPLFTSSPLRDSAHRDFFSISGTSVFSTPAVSPEPTGLYEQLIDAVIRQAEALGNLPKVAQSILAPASGHLGLVTRLAVGSYSMEENDSNSKIGAAGELFVFEILKALHLPDFSCENWQSTIRHRVSLHERYNDLHRWFGSETSDIVYKDRYGSLTQILIDRGYLNAAIWSGRKPKYFIEVKTTVGSVNTPFYCSQSQYDRMERMELVANSPSDKVYLVARIFNLGDSGMGVKLYLDPAALRRNRQLEFRADRYSVTPM